METELPGADFLADLTEAVNRFADLEQLQSHAVAIQIILRDWFETHGYIPVPPEDLN